MPEASARANDSSVEPRTHHSQGDPAEHLRSESTSLAKAALTSNQADKPNSSLQQGEKPPVEKSAATPASGDSVPEISKPQQLRNIIAEAPQILKTGGDKAAMELISRVAAADETGRISPAIRTSFADTLRYMAISQRLQHGDPGTKTDPHKFSQMILTEADFRMGTGRALPAYMITSAQKYDDLAASHPPQILGVHVARNNMEDVSLHSAAGTTVKGAATLALEKATALKGPVELAAGGVEVVVRPGQSSADVIADYRYARSEKGLAEYALGLTNDYIPRRDADDNRPVQDYKDAFSDVSAALGNDDAMVGLLRDHGHELNGMMHQWRDFLARYMDGHEKGVQQHDVNLRTIDSMAIINGAAWRLHQEHPLPRDINEILRADKPFYLAAQASIEEANRTGNPVSMYGLTKVNPDTRLEQAAGELRTAMRRSSDPLEQYRKVYADYGEELTSNSRSYLNRMTPGELATEPEPEATRELVRKGYLTRVDAGLVMTPDGEEFRKNSTFNPGADFRTAGSFDGTLDSLNVALKTNDLGSFAESTSDPFMREQAQKLSEMKLTEPERSRLTRFLESPKTIGLTSALVLAAGAAMIAVSRREQYDTGYEQPTFESLVK